MVSRFALDLEPSEDTALRGMFRKIREEVNNNMEEKHRRKQRAKHFVRWVIALQLPSQLYMFMVYIIPYLFEEYDGWTRYFLKIGITFIVIQLVSNYLCTVLYSTDVEKTTDRPFINGITNRWDNPPDRFETHSMSNGSTQNGFIPHSSASEENNGLIWKYCDKCGIPKPPRAHHCDVCKACILKRDHHCYMVGTCIGFRNQRYFAVLTFYTVLCGFIGGYFTYKYLQLLYYPVSYSWTDFIPPVAFYRWIFGTVNSLSLHIAIMITQVYIEYMFGLLCFFYFASQMTIISKGITLYELAKFVPIKNHKSVNENFRSVFGDFWGLNFLFPMTILFRQRENGVDWEGVKIDYNANEEKNN